MVDKFMLQHKSQLYRKYLLAFIFVMFLSCYPPIVGSPQSTDVHELIQSLKESPDPCSAAEALGNLKASEAIKPLVDIIKHHKDRRVRRCAAEALADIGDKKAFDLLVSSLNDKDLITASRSAYALGILKDPGATKPLLHALTESNIPCPAAEALGRIKDPRSVEPLIEALKHEDKSVRSCAVIALGMIGDPRAIEPLTDTFMQDSDPITQRRARIALKMIKNSHAKEQSQKYLIEDKFCNMGQKLIDIIPQLIEKYPNQKEWSKSQEWNKAFSEIAKELDRLEYKDPDAQKRLYALIFYITDWSDAVGALRNLTLKGNTIGDKTIMTTAIDRIEEKETIINTWCPNMKFPDHTK